jgi:hypothetical protein
MHGIYMYSKNTKFFRPFYALYIIYNKWTTNLEYLKQIKRKKMK